MANIRIEAIGGYGEIGKNMTAITVNGDVVLLDMGMHMENLLNHVPDSQLGSFSREEMINWGIIPDDSHIDPDSVVGIVPSHGHLDHIAGIPYLESRYDCNIYATPYTAQVLRRQFKDNGFKRRNRIRSTQYGKIIKLSKNISIEFVFVTHSIPHASIVAIHTPQGVICYANDYKFDDEPTGEISDYARLEQLGSNCICLISECLYARKLGRTPFESVAKTQLTELMNKYNTKGIFVTTFTSHVYRVETIVKLAKAMNRKVALFGRSLEKYLTAAKMAGVSRVIDEVELYPYKSQIKRKLRQVGRDKHKYVFLMTGHQAEENAVLNSMVSGALPNIFAPNDLFIFSCHTIPTDAIQKARAQLEKRMDAYHMHMFKDVHVSGHASVDDLQKLVKLVKPRLVIPSHGVEEMMNAYMENVAIPLKVKCHKLYTGKGVDLE